MAAGEAVLAAVRKHLLPQFGLSVSVMLDSNGANTTAVAALLAAAKHLDLPKCRSLVLGGTGPVGLRVARLLAKRGGHVRIGSRQLDRAEQAAAGIRKAVPGAAVEAVSVGSSSGEPLGDRELVVAAGAPGAVLLPRSVRDKATGLKTAHRPERGAAGRHRRGGGWGQGRSEGRWGGLLWGHRGGRHPR